MSDDKDTANGGTAQEKSFFERAQEVIESAVESTVEAVKEHPLAASAIAAGAAAAVAGAAYGASKLLDKDDEDADGSAKG
jgi:carbonic anhydrase